jgi:PIN like domain
VTLPPAAVNLEPPAGHAGSSPGLSAWLPTLMPSLPAGPAGPLQPGVTLRSSSHGYYPPSDEEYLHGWETAAVVLDASVLLSLYRYSTETRDELLNLLASFTDRLWLRHQAALEYERNRLSVINQQLSAYGRTLDRFAKQLGSIRAEFSKLARHPLLDEAELSKLPNARKPPGQVLARTRQRSRRRQSRCRTVAFSRSS